MGFLFRGWGQTESRCRAETFEMGLFFSGNMDRADERNMTGLREEEVVLTGRIVGKRHSIVGFRE